MKAESEKIQAENETKMAKKILEDQYKIILKRQEDKKKAEEERIRLENETMNNES